MSGQGLALGALNGHIVGLAVKEMVRRAAVAIHTERAVFESRVKESYGGTMDDVCTSADKKAQQIYLRSITECFPDCGIIAEEDDLRIEPKNGCTAYFTIDPLDGTKAYTRRQSHGVATMIALVDKGEVICAFIADVNADEAYGYRPSSRRVHRITRLNAAEVLGPGDHRFVPGRAHALLRDPLGTYSPATQQLVARVCENHEVMGSSIGTWIARLWKREVDFVVIGPGHETPWDSTPVIGISLQLGYVFLRPLKDGRLWERYDPELPTTVGRREHDLLIAHELDLPALAVTA